MKRAATDLQARWPTLTYKPPALPSAPPVDRTAIVLGRAADRSPVLLPLKARLEHMLVLGATGSGKSRFLFSLMRQMVALAEGLLFIDPHGSAEYADLIAWLAAIGRQAQVIDFSGNRTVGFNPLECPSDTDPSVIVGNVMDAMSVSWEGESLAQKPSIERVLTAAVGALTELKLTLCECDHLFDRNDRTGLRRYAIQHVHDPFTRKELQRLQELSEDGRRKRDYDQEIVGPDNRLARLLRPPAIRAMIGQTKDCIDFKSIMDDGGVVLANLSGGTQAYEKETDLFGRLLTRTVLFHAKRREITHPFNVVMDEAHRYMSADTPTLLAEVRKYGVAIVAAMQYLAQAGKADDPILASLLNGPNCKVCFRLRDADEAERMARSLVPLNLERPVTALIKPSVIGHTRVLLANESRSESNSVANGTSKAVARGRSDTEGEAFTTGTTTTHGEAHSVTDSETHAQSQSESENHGSSSSEIVIPADDGPIISRETVSESEGTGTSKGTSEAHGRSTGTVKSSSLSEIEMHTISRAKTLSNTVTDGKSRVETSGTGQSRGHSEAFEPVMANLPSAVHSIQNELYAAGSLLRGLPRGKGFVAYVGQHGPVTSLFDVPPLFTAPLPPERFAELRDACMPNSVPTADALRTIATRVLPTNPVEPPKPKAPRPKRAKPINNDPGDSEATSTW